MDWNLNLNLKLNFEFHLKFEFVIRFLNLDLKIVFIISDGITDDSFCIITDVVMISFLYHH